MQIVYTADFENAFTKYWNFIAEDSVNRANIFQSALKKALESLSYMPYRFRQSIYFEEQEYRDLVFKGYVIPYMVDEANDVLIVMDMIKWIQK